MRFKADENLPIEVAEALREAGFDAGVTGVPPVHAGKMENLAKQKAANLR